MSGGRKCTFKNNVFKIISDDEDNNSIKMQNSNWQLVKSRHHDIGKNLSWADNAQKLWI